VSEKQLGEFEDKRQALLNIKRAPSQYMILFHLLSTGKTMTVRALAKELELTPKATERAVAKLVEKGLIQKSTFKGGSYHCDSKQILLSLLITNLELYEDYKKRH
jgi:DNA-binding MarR family transcriptional regulator